MICSSCKNSFVGADNLQIIAKKIDGNTYGRLTNYFWTQFCVVLVEYSFIVLRS